MQFPLAREFINQLDENGENKGIVTPCDIFKHLKERGISPFQAAITTAFLSVMGGLSTNPSCPIYSRTDGVTREVVNIDRSIDPLEVLRDGSGVLIQHILTMAEALLVPSLSKTVERKVTERSLVGGNVKKKNGFNGVLKVAEALFQNRDAISTLMKPLVDRHLSGKK